jgi:hypothetical protein
LVRHFKPNPFFLQKRKIRHRKEDVIKIQYKVTVKRRSLIEIKIIRHVLQIAKIGENLEKYF